MEGENQTGGLLKRWFDPSLPRRDFFREAGRLATGAAASSGLSLKRPLASAFSGGAQKHAGSVAAVLSADHQTLLRVAGGLSSFCDGWLSTGGSTYALSWAPDPLIRALKEIEIFYAHWSDGVTFLDVIQDPSEILSDRHIFDTLTIAHAQDNWMDSDDTPPPPEKWGLDIEDPLQRECFEAAKGDIGQGGQAVGKMSRQTLKSILNQRRFFIKKKISQTLPLWQNADPALLREQLADQEAIFGGYDEEDFDHLKEIALFATDVLPRWAVEKMLAVADPSLSLSSLLDDLSADQPFLQESPENSWPIQIMEAPEESGEFYLYIPANIAVSGPEILLGNVADMLRLDLEEQEGTEVIYDRDAGYIRVINHQKGSYAPEPLHYFESAVQTPSHPSPGGFV